MEDDKKQNRRHNDANQSDHFVITGNLFASRLNLNISIAENLGQNLQYPVSLQYPVYSTLFTRNFVKICEEKFITVFKAFECYMKKFGDEAFFSLISGQRYFFIIFENLKTFWFCDFFRSGGGGNSGLKWNKIKTESKMVKKFFRKMIIVVKPRGHQVFTFISTIMNR